jgi:hypothetical protein
MKLSYEITDTQKDIILDNAKRRVMEILSYDEDNVARYFRTFISSLYTDMRKYKGLGSKVATTKKRNYDNVIEGIDAWVPECGINNLKIKVDSRASANKRAKAAGY